MLFKKNLKSFFLTGFFTSLILSSSAPRVIAAVCNLDDDLSLVKPNIPSTLPNLKPFPNATGHHATYNPTGTLNLSDTNDFFNVIGTNGRNCGNCHAPQTAWSITPGLARMAFKQTQGLGPLFRVNDGSNSPTANISTESARCKAFTMLLKYADIRVTLPLPNNTNFTLTDSNISDPYKYASVAHGLSLFRRPMPTTNLQFIKAVMWDGRETVLDNTGAFIQFDSLGNQAGSATTGHAEGPVISNTQKANIVNFEKQLYTAQLDIDEASRLDVNFAKGGPVNLADPAIATPDSAPGTSSGFNIYDAWTQLTGHEKVDLAQEAIARGQIVFNSGNLGMRATNPPSPRHCTTCHVQQNVGNYLVQTANTPDSETFFNVRASDPDFIKKINATLLSELPKYTLELTVSSGKAIPAGAIDTATNTACTANSVKCKITTTDPGRGLITGKYSDINKFRVPSLRGLAGRPPYFHNGLARTINDVVQHYVNVFGMTVSTSTTHSTNPNVITKQEISDLVAFLSAL